MKRKPSFALTAGSALGLWLAAAAPAEAGRIANRQDRQQTRIANGISNGELNARETTRGEHLRIEAREDRISRGIFRQKHDRQ